MKWYQPIECDNTVKNPLVCDFSNLEQLGYNRSVLKQGVFINDWKESVYFKAKKKRNEGEPDDALQNYLMLPIYSSSLIIALDKNEIKGMQYLPIKVINFNGDCLKGFCIANILILLKLLTKKSLILTDLARIFRTRMLEGK